MDILFNAANNFKKLVDEECKYECILSYSRRCLSFFIDFEYNDFFHLTGLQYLNDIDIPQNRKKTIDIIVNEKKLAEEDLKKSDKYLHPAPNLNIPSRIAHLQYLEQYLDTDNFINVFTLRNLNNVGSNINADYLIESKIDEIPGSVYIFIKERYERPGCYAVISFFEKGNRCYAGDMLHWMKKTKISISNNEVLYQHEKFNDFLEQQKNKN